MRTARHRYRDKSRMNASAPLTQFSGNPLFIQRCTAFRRAFFKESVQAFATRGFWDKFRLSLSGKFLFQCCYNKAAAAFVSAGDRPEELHRKLHADDFSGSHTSSSTEMAWFVKP